jgi:hypothetical protein
MSTIATPSSPRRPRPAPGGERQQAGEPISFPGAKPQREDRRDSRNSFLHYVSIWIRMPMRTRLSVRRSSTDGCRTSPTSRRRPEFWRACAAQPWAPPAIAKRSAKACPKCASLSAGLSRLFRAQRRDCLRSAPRRRQVDAEAGHRARESDGAPIEEDETMTTTCAPFDAAAYLDNDELIAESPRPAAWRGSRRTRGSAAKASTRR